MSSSEKAADSFVRVAAEADLPPGSLLGVEANGVKLCLANADGQVYAFRDNCTHRDFPLSAGTLEDGEVECTWHGAKFDVASGRATRLPAIKPVQTCDVRVEDGDIYVSVEP